MAEDPLFAVLPYLKSSSPVIVRGIRFIPSSAIQSEASIPESAKYSLQDLTSMFRLPGNEPIPGMICAYLAPNQSPSFPQVVLRRLNEARTLITYLYSSPHFPGSDPFLGYEHGDLYVFRSSGVSPHLVFPRPPDISSQPMGIDGYEGYKNFHDIFWVTTSSTIWPPLPHFVLNLSQDLYHDIELQQHAQYYSPFVDLITSREPLDDRTETRTLTAMAWYNRSASSYFGEEFAIVSLAVAFETLFDLEEGPNLSSRFLDAVRLLIGKYSRLDSWVHQFYTARSRILHKGHWPHLGFYPTNPEAVKAILKGEQRSEFYRSLTAYGRRIFRLCVAGILTSSMAAADTDLEGLLHNNQERLERICEILSDHTKLATERLRLINPLIRALHEFWLESERTTKILSVIAAGRLTASTFLEALPSPPDHVGVTLQAVLDTGGVSEHEALQRFRAANEAVSQWLPTIRPSLGLPLSATHTLASYLQFASMPGFLLRTSWPTSAG
jgi:hypothetical protein